MSQPEKSLEKLLASVDSPVGRQRVAEYLASRPFPHYEPAWGVPGLLIRTDVEGAQTTGRFIGREFQAAP